MKRCTNRDCYACHPDDDPPGPGPAWAWPWSFALLLLLFAFAYWFVTSGAFRPDLTP